MKSWDVGGLAGLQGSGPGLCGLGFPVTPFEQVQGHPSSQP